MQPKQVHGVPDARWLEVAGGVFARRYLELDQTLGLVLGDRRALVVDTGRDEQHGAEFAAAVRELTALPLTVVLTHAHFDHCLGTAAFLPAEVWAHESCVVDDRVLAERAEFYPEPLDVRLVEPTHRVRAQADLDLGVRVVRLIHPGRGHTDHDLVVHVPDAGVLFAGDLVEQGAEPSVGPDAYPGDWPHALDALLALKPSMVVPGHGEPVDAAFVRQQRDELAARA